MTGFSHILHVTALSALLVCQMFGPAEGRVHGVRRALRTISTATTQQTLLSRRVVAVHNLRFDS